ncbi:hypothetical protein POM88_003665 [Heracleum sosnowskyi]|uniref:Uncharacterized protein n=1 Tax=Heracleum sosnowskyi TaxID=360622 RepID=A0AAD8JGD4_9APIA|nr:hypothetical protein POM88_003665 [Heracleum sosnowskyi]
MASSAILHSPSMFSQRLAIYPQQHQRIRITSKKFGNRAARTESKGVSLGFRPPQFQLTEPLTGSVWESEDFQSHPALLIMKNKKMSNKARSSPHSTTLNVNRALNKTREIHMAKFARPICAVAFIFPLKRHIHDGVNLHGQLQYMLCFFSSYAHEQENHRTASSYILFSKYHSINTFIDSLAW